MTNRLILYDFGPEDRARQGQIGQDYYFPAQPPVGRCLGCFGCWIKTPGRCVIQDRASVLPEQLKNCNEWVIISPLLYGGYSIAVKAALERCLGYLLPYLRVNQGWMGHQPRYPHRWVQLQVCFYGPCPAEQQQLARRLVRANSRNLEVQQWQTQFFETAQQAKEAAGWKF